jgi:hypothetical protein
MVVGLVLLTDDFFKDRAGRTTSAFGGDFGVARCRRERRFAASTPIDGNVAGQSARALCAPPARAMTAAEVVSSNQTSPVGVMNSSTENE